MVIVFGGGAAGAIVKMKCPHCGVEQVRARQAETASYECRACHRRFLRKDAAHPLSTARPYKK